MTAQFTAQNTMTKRPTRAKDLDQGVTTVIDAGARYGMHPSWRGFGAPLRYYAFEPDHQEAERLRRQAQPPGFEVIDLGLASLEGERDLHITKHRGYSSFLDVDPNSDWFGRYRPGEGEVEAVVRVKTCTLDGFAKDRGVCVDFLKLDTEGSELEILKGAPRQLSLHTMGIRVNVNFLPQYKDQMLFPDVHSFLMDNGFYLVNLDYFGRGLPHHGLFHNPDPQALDLERYGVLIAADGVWLLDYPRVVKRLKGQSDALAYATLKYAYFCILNHAHDVGLDTLVTFIEKEKGSFSPQVMSSKLYLSLRKVSATLLGRWRVYPDSQWDLARATFQKVFGLELEGGSRYWEMIQDL